MNFFNKNKEGFIDDIMHHISGATDGGSDDPISEKKAEKFEAIKKSWSAYILSLLPLLLYIIIASYIVLNFFFAGVIPAEVIFPTVACLPPYMSRTPPDCDEAIDVRYLNDETRKIREKSMYKRCPPSAFKERWKEGLDEEFVKLFESIQLASKKKQSWEYTRIAAFNKQYWEDKGYVNAPKRFAALYIRLIIIKTFINIRKQHHTLHSLFKNLDGKFSFAILLFLIASLMIQSNFFPLLLSISTFYNFYVMINYFVVTITDHTLQIFNPAFWICTAFLIPWIWFFFLKDLICNYLVLFVTNTNVRKICSCKLSEYWPIVSLLFVFFAIKKAELLLDAPTVTALWIVYGIFIIINRKKIFGSSTSSKTPTSCEDAKVFKKNS